MSKRQQNTLFIALDYLVVANHPYRKIDALLSFDELTKPYRSWECGQNENANGLLRQYFPKSMKLTDVRFNEVKIAFHKLNTRPRKCLGFKTPNQVFFEHTGIDARLLAVVRL